MVGRRLALYPQTRMDPSQWAAWWQDYFDACADVPEEALEAGMAAHVRDPMSEFLPKPGKLRELSLTTPNRAAKALERVQRAVRLVDAEREDRPPPSPEMRAEVGKLMERFRQEMAVRRPPEPEKPKRPPCQGQVDETGVTQAMRDLMARRNGTAA